MVHTTKRGRHIYNWTNSTRKSGASWHVTTIYQHRYHNRMPNMIPAQTFKFFIKDVCVWGLLPALKAAKSK